MKLKDGIFAEYRSKGVDVSSNRYFSIFNSFPHAKGAKYCEHDISGGEVWSIVSDDMNLAWASDDTSSSDNKYVDFLFSESKISVQGIAIQTLCGPPNEIVFEGTKDEGSTWETICSKNTSFPPENIVEIVCLNPKAFSYFRLRQIGKNTGHSTYRFHIYKFEMYGKISNNFAQYITCMKSSKRPYCPIIYVIIMSIK